MSRVVEGRFLFDMKAGASVKADFFVGLMRRLETFCGVQVLTYCLMSNHFHILEESKGTGQLFIDNFANCSNISLMRQPRLKIRGGEGVYHCMSRVVEGRFLFNMCMCE